MFQEKKLNIKEMVSKLLDEDDNANGSEILKNEKVKQLIKKIFNQNYNSSDVQELMRMFYPLEKEAMIQQRKLREYMI